jgi:hypothetical protein
MTRSNPDVEEFVNRMVDEGRILASHRKATEALLSYLSLHHGEILYDGMRISPRRAFEFVLAEMVPVSAEERFNSLAEEKAREKGISYGEAFREVQSEFPALAREYANFSSASSSSGAGGEYRNPGERLALLAEEKSRREGISFQEAFYSVQLENPELARRYIRFYRIKRV